MAFLNEIGAKLQAAGVGIVGSNIFLSSRAKIPDGDGPYLSLTDTGGTAPTRVQEKTTPNTVRPTAQICVRAAKTDDAKTMAQAAYNALDGTFNATLSGTFYQKITARQELTDIGLDATGRRIMIVFNIEVEKNPS